MSRLAFMVEVKISSPLTPEYRGEGRGCRRVGAWARGNGFFSPGERFPQISRAADVPRPGAGPRIIVGGSSRGSAPKERAGGPGGKGSTANLFRTGNPLSNRPAAGGPSALTIWQEITQSSATPRGPRSGARPSRSGPSPRPDPPPRTSAPSYARSANIPWKRRPVAAGRARSTPVPAGPTATRSSPCKSPTTPPAAPRTTPPKPPPNWRPWIFSRSIRSTAKPSSPLSTRSNWPGTSLTFLTRSYSVSGASKATPTTPVGR